MDEAKLRLLVDKTEIRDVVLRYAYGVDRRDWAALRSCFIDEIEADFTSHWGGSPRRLKADDWVAGVRRTVSGFQATQHTMSNCYVTVNGDEATCIMYMQAQHYLPNDKGDNFLLEGGYYTDNLVRTAQGWKIRKVKLTLTWMTGNHHVFDLARERYASLQEKQG